MTKPVLFLCMAWGQERDDKTSTFSMNGLGIRKIDKTSTFSMYGLGTRYRCDKTGTFSMSYGLGTRKRCDKTSTFSMYGLGE